MKKLKCVIWVLIFAVSSVIGDRQEMRKEAQLKFATMLKEMVRANLQVFQAGNRLYKLEEKPLSDMDARQKGLSELTPTKSSHKKDVSNKYAGLLRNLVEVNEKRFEAVRQLAKLQDYSLDGHNLRTKYKKSAKNKLRSRNEDQLESAEDHQYTPSSGPYLVFLRQGESSSNTSNQNHVSEKDLNQLAKSSDDNMPVCPLWSSDDVGEPIARTFKKALCSRGRKLCKRACKSALKSVCSTHSCRSKMRKRYRRECKSNCKSLFKG